MNLRLKIHLASASLVLIVVIGMMSSLYISEKKQLLNEIRREQKEDLEKLRSVYEEAMALDIEISLFNYIRTLVVNPEVSYAGIVNRDGSGWIYPGTDAGSLMYVDAKDKAVQEILNSGRLMRRLSVSARGERVIEISRPLDKGSYVRLAYSRKMINALIAERLALSLKKLTGVGILAIFFGLLLAHLLSRALSKPILNLMGATAAIAKGSKGITIPEAGKDELGKLTRTFNHMSKELVKLDELKDEFMSHVTHELRSPLTSIIATVELLDEMPEAHTKPKLRRSVDRLKYGSDRLNNLVDNILDLTRMEAGKMQFDIQPVNMGTLACEMADFFEPRAMEKNLFIRAEVPETLPRAMADPERIRQVLSNLIHNAIKFTNKGGITIWVRQIDKKIQVGVQDTGVGIPKENLATVFSKFETLKDTRDRVDKPVPGSGLGLNIVLNSVQSQNGKIWVESEVKKGTTFIFELPIDEDGTTVGTKTADTKESMSSPKQDRDRGSLRQPILMNDNESEQAVQGE
ncbi:hypothetical protein BVX98_00645 [bacterium F11]|nr:hypothetical protein BVX98_00645 [bacterium F11]